MQRARQCATCQDLVVDKPHSFEVSIEDVNRSSWRCSICFLLAQASGIYESIRKSPVQKIEIVKSKPEYGPLLILRWDDSGDQGSYQFLRLFYTSREHETRSLVCSVRRIIPSEPSLDYYAGTITSWLTTCLLGHQNCREAQASTESRLMPARLLYIGTSEDRTIKIVDFTDPIVTYVALSYCWGAGSRLTLTEDTLHSFQSSIPWDIIPRTIQDAIALTVQFQISYIWVDALCILQDSRQDWQRESVKMKDIYKHARLVLSTDRAANTDTGFLTSRRPAGHIVQIPGSHPEAGHMAEILVAPDGHGEEHDADPYDRVHQWFLSGGEGFGTGDEFVTQNPVFGRAWCLQEQILAVRTIHFTDSEMIWECFEDSYCECEGINEYNRRGCLRSKLSMTVPELQLWKRTWFNLRKMRDPSALLREWWGCVEQYSSRKLGVESDILPAISGLAKEFPEDILGRYHSGQWSKDFPFGLLWHSDEGVHTHHRAEYYNAPSWSWASVVGTIMRPPSMYDPVAIAKVTHPMTWPVGTDWYGQIKDASLTLTAPMVDISASYDWTEGSHITWHLHPSEEGQRTMFHRTCKVFFDLAPTFPYNMETLDEYLSSLDLTCAFVAKGIVGDSTREVIFAMLLSPVHGEKCTFERVGVAQIFLNEQYHDINLEDYTINIV